MEKYEKELNLGKVFILGGISRETLKFLCKKNEMIVINPHVDIRDSDESKSIYEYEEYGLLNLEPQEKKGRLLLKLKKETKIIYFITFEEIKNDMLGKEFLENGYNCYYCSVDEEILLKIKKKSDNWFEQKYNFLKKKYDQSIKGLRMPWEQKNIFLTYINVYEKSVSKKFVSDNRYYIINILENTDENKIREEIWFNLDCLLLSDSLLENKEIRIETKEELFRFINDVFIKTSNSKARYVFRGMSREIEFLPLLYRKGIEIIKKHIDILKLDDDQQLKKLFDFLYLEYNSNLSIDEMKENLLEGICKKIEKELLRKFEENCGLYFSNIGTEYDFISNAQHYGVATRLLDWTYNIYAALLFAVFSNESPDGEYYKVLALDLHKHIYCDKILDISRSDFSSFNFEKILNFYESIKEIYDEDEFGKMQEIQKIFKNSINESINKEKYSSSYNNSKDTYEKKYIDRLSEKFKEKRLFFIVPPFSNQRIASQQGVLQVVTTYDTNSIFTLMKKFCYVIKINKNLRNEIIQHVEKMGHNMFKIMPDISNGSLTIMKKTLDKMNGELYEITKPIKKEINKKVSILFLYPVYYDLAHYNSSTRKEIPPFGVMYLASIAKKLGLNVEIRAISNNANEIIDFSEYEIVAYSIPSSITYSMIKNINDRAIYSSKVLKIVGGIHATLYPEKVFNDMKPDVLLLGEGENSIAEVIKHYIDRDFSRIVGVYKKGVKYIASKVDKLDDIPFPARELMPKEDILINRLYSAEENRILKIVHIICSRGCNYRCNFCGNQLRPIRYRSGENVVSEIEMLAKKYKEMEGFCIIDDNFLIENKEVVDIIYQILLFNENRETKLKWSALSRADIGKFDNGTFSFKKIKDILTSSDMLQPRFKGIDTYADDNILEFAKKAGCIELKFGLESGSPEVLRKMNKSKNGKEYLKKAAETLKFAKSISISTKVFLIYGYPGETANNLKETCSFMKENKINITRVSLFSFAPLPGSKIWEEKYKNIELESESFEKLFLYDNDQWFDSKQICSEYESQLNTLKDIVKGINNKYEKLIQ